MSTVADSLRRAVEATLGTAVADAVRLRGGDVAQSFRMELVGGARVFAKAHPGAPPGCFDTEARGLRWLRAAGAVAVPEVLGVGDDPAFLILEWIDEGRPTAATDPGLGAELAALHAAGAPSFGRADRRPTGSRSLPNDPAASWAEFYADRRLRPLARLAADQGALPAPAIADLERVADRMPLLAGPDEPPARLHGDLWAGNRVVDGTGRNWLIDPACFGGHREFDLAMMRLFGGFSEPVFTEYAAHHPLSEGWEERVELHQLAPLVVHAIKFGGGYVPAAQRALQRYV